MIYEFLRQIKASDTKKRNGKSRKHGFVKSLAESYGLNAVFTHGTSLDF